MASSKDECIFCKIIAGELPAEKVYEDEDVVAFLDINPTTRGHTLVVPKAHHETLLKTPPELLKKIVAVLPGLAEAAVEATGSDGFNILQSNEPCAGQCVFHIHFHIVPRKPDDGIGLGFRQQEPVADDLAATAEAIRQAL